MRRKLISSKNGGEGCYCADHALLRQLLSKKADVTVIDSEAGLEHLSRGTIADIDIALVVIEPGRRSLEKQRLAGAAIQTRLST